MTSRRFLLTFGPCMGLLLAVCVRPTALAQPPAPARLVFPLAVQGLLQNNSETSCSQSFATDSRSATIVLRVDRRGRATLTSDIRTRSRSGPSLGRYRGGDREFSVLQSHSQEELSGTAQRTGDRLTVAFDRLESASARWQGEGELALSAPTSGPSAAILRCTLTPTEVYPARPAPDEQPRSMPAFACSFFAPPPGLRDFGIEGLNLAPGQGLRTIRDTTGLSPTTTSQVRAVE